MKRVTLIVTDSMGVGQLPDAANYGDTGADTFGHIAERVENFEIPNLKKLGIGNITNVAGGKLAVAADEIIGSYGRMGEISKGKDTITGHWEIAGIETPAPF